MIEETIESHSLQRSDTLSLIVFYLLAFGISWLGFVPMIAGSIGLTFFQSSLWQGALVLSGIGPAAAAGIASACFPSPAKVDAKFFTRLKRSFLRRVPFRWWAVTILLSIGIMVAASLLSVRIDHARFASNASASSVFLFSIMSIAANPLEEIGWRGFAQTRLQRTHQALTAASIVGILWVVWHIPLFLLSSSPMSMSHTPFWPWAAGVVPQAILLAWLYNRTGQSLLIVSVFHFLGNLSGYMLHASVGKVSTVRIVAALIVFWMAGPRLGQLHADGVGPIRTALDDKPTL